MFKIIINTILHPWQLHKTRTAISILGLAIGIGCSLVIYKIISYETSFDSYHTNYKNTYRIINEFTDPIKGISLQEAQVHLLGKALRNHFSNIDAVMLFYASKAQVSVINPDGSKNKYMESKGLVYAEPNIFRIFDFDFIAGDALNAITNKESVVITSSLAQKYFNLSASEVRNALNRIIKIENKKVFQITGVISDPPKNSDLQFSLIANYKDQEVSNPYYRKGNNWRENNSATNCFVVLPDKMSASTFEQKLIAFQSKYFVNTSARKHRYILEPLSKLHFSKCSNYNKKAVPKKNLVILGIIGLFLILIASINFINLITVQTSKRFKEIGIKNILGEDKIQSTFHFFMESLILSFIASIVSLFIAHFLLTYIQNKFGYSLNVDILKDGNSYFFLSIISILVGLIGGIYQAHIIARMNPIVALKNSSTEEEATHISSNRRALVIVLFILSITIISTTLFLNI